MSRNTNIKFRRGTLSEWNSANPVLASGEPGFEIDTGRVKIGNGTTAWSGLYYNSIIPTGLIAGNNININLGTNGSTATIAVTGVSVSGHNHSSTEVNILSQEPQGFVNRHDSSISFNDSTRTFTIQPATTGSSYTLYIEGIKVIKNTVETVVLGTGTALNYIHFDTTPPYVLQTKTSAFDFDTDVPIAFIHWNGDINQSTFFGEERHGIKMDSMTHKWIHNTFGMQYINGLSIGGYTLLGNGSSNSHAQFDLSDGTLYQEDIIINVTNGVGAGSFIQQLSPIAYIPVYYHSGTTGQWVRDTATSFPLKYNATRAQYNLYSGGTWTTPNVGDKKYFAMWIVATNDINEPILAIVGQREDASLNSAQSSNNWSDIDLTNIPTSEIRPLYRLIFITDNTFTNTPKSSLQSILDIRVAIQSTSIGVVQNDHGILFGLADDDHSQYVHTNNARTIDAIHTFSNGLNASGLINASSGNFSSLKVNNTGVSLVDHTHTYFASLSIGDGSLTDIGSVVLNTPYDWTYGQRQDAQTFSIYGDASVVFSINALGQVVGGSWRGDTIDVDKGGTGRTSYSNGQLLIGSGTSLVANTLSAGTGISITNGSGTITINTSGVSLVGHNHNGIYADIATGDPTVITNSIVDNAYAMYDPVNGWPGLWINDSSILASDPAIFDSFKINMGLTEAVIGTGIVNHIPYWNSSSGISNSLIRQNIDTVYVSGNLFVDSVGRFGDGMNYVGIGGDILGSELGIVNISNNKVIAVQDTSDGSFRYGGSRNSEYLIIQSGGNVGIGTDTPTEKLTVNGNGNFNGNIFVGSISGSDPLTISTPTASMVINDYTIFLYSDVKTEANLQLSDSSTADSLLVTDGNKNVVSLISPSLTEISYVSGVTSNIQTQLDSKQNTLTNPVTGSGVANHIPYWSSTSGLLADSNQLVWDSTNNRLGIGTSTPSGQLHVVGTGIFTGVDINNSAIAGQGALTVNGNIITQNNIIRGGTFSIYGDNNTRIYKADGSTLNYSVSSSGYKHSFGYDITGNHTSWMTINNTGIGIRTNSPGATLDVRGSAVFNENGSNVDFRIEGDTDTHLFFVDASADNVGIGYSTPTTKLQVNGTFSCGGGYGGEPAYGGQGLFADPALPLLRLIDSGPNTVADIDINGLTLYDIASNPFFYTDRTNSRIGLGTNAPNANLAISAGGAGGIIDGAAQSQPFQINDATASDYINLAHFNITNSGSRGSFTLSNNSSGAWENNVMQFFIHGNAYGHGYYGGNSNDAGCAMIVTQGSQINKLQIGNISSVPIEFFTGNAFRMKIDSDGDVGIGIATPLYKLDVNGTIGNSTNGYVVVQDLTISNSTAGTISIDAATNNLTIGGDGTITINSNVDQQVNINSNVDVNGDLTFNSYTEKVVAIGNSSTSQTIDLSSGTVQTCTLTGNCTFTMPTATAGKSFSLFLNTGTGGYSATFTGVRWSDSTPPTITSTASKVDLLSFISDGTYWYGSFSQNYG